MLSPQKTLTCLKPWPETKALIREREFVDIDTQCDLEFYWLNILQKSMVSVGKTMNF